MSSYNLQIIDWHCENSIETDVDALESDSDDSFNSDNEEVEELNERLKYKIIVFGKDLDENTYSIQINNFTPYYYLKVPEYFEEYHKPVFKKWIKNKLPKQYKNDLQRITLHNKKKFRGFNNNRCFKYIRLVFTNVIAMKKSINLFQDKTWDDENKKYINIKPKKLSIAGITERSFIFELYDNMIDPMIRFIHHSNVKPVGWIKAKKCTERSDNLTHCKYNLETDWKQISCVECDENIKIKIMSYDIECDSSHGDFPRPIKDYLKFAREVIIEYVRLKKIGHVVMKTLLEESIKVAFEDGNEYISKVYTKIKNKKPTEQQIKRLTESCSDLMKGYDDNKKVLEKNAIKNESISLLNNKMNKFPKVQGDKTIQIGCSFLKYGDTVPYRNVMLTLKSCDPVKNTEVISFKRETDLLLKFKELILEEDPEIITGYNIEGFDTPWLVKRAQELKIEDEFTHLSRFKENRIDDKGNKLYCELKEKQEKSPVGELVTVEFIVIPGRIQLDILKLVRQGYNLSSYKLDDVSAEFVQGPIKSIIYNDVEKKTYIETNNSKGLNIGNFIILVLKDSYLETKYLDGKKFEIIDIKDNNLIVNDRITLDCIKNTCIWCLGKDDVTPQDIFRLQKGTSKDRYIVAKYCMMDVILCIELLLKLELINNLLGIANVCLIPFD